VRLVEKIREIAAEKGITPDSPAVPRNRHPEREFSVTVLLWGRIPTSGQDSGSLLTP
jgi:hypothetical protein